MAQVTDRRGALVGADALRLSRIVADGKHLAVAGETFVVRGVTYGSFVPRRDGSCYPETAQLRCDFAQIAALGLNTVRVYTAPPPDLLEAAEEHAIRVLAGIHYRDWRYEYTPGREAQRRVRDGGRRALDELLLLWAGRPELLAVSVGNEVPADIVRVHGIVAVQDVLSEFAAHVHEADPDVLVTYTNYPTTEYLQVDGLSLATYNVFLEDAAALRRYIRHLQVVSGELPFVLTELGLAAHVHGDDAQAESLGRQLLAVDEVGCAGATVFSFTDEWGVNGEAVDGWGFGITTADRTPKAATTVVESWARGSVADVRTDWPTISVVVCAYDEQRTIEECLTSLARCDYPALEVVVCDDGSTDRTLEIARRFPFRILELPHGGLSEARNAGIAASTGDIVAFLDADAACHPHWPWHLALAFENDSVVAAGGPNLAFPSAPLIERTVALSPGAPTEVLLSDDRAEHVPGCNMAFRREAINAIGCFDPQYTSAGDDVDVCWKVLDKGGEIAFSYAAQVRHHRRSTVKSYLRQQRGYGRAEKLLWSAHCHRFNRLGQARWAGFIYGGARLLPSVLRPIVYHGYQGNAAFQTVTSRPAEAALGSAGAVLPLSLPVAVAGIVAAVAMSPWWIAVTLFAVVAVVFYGVAVAVALQVPFGEPEPRRLRLLVGVLHVAQPFARSWGRLRGPRRVKLEPVSRQWWGDRASWLQDLERRFRADGGTVRIGGPNDDWDLEIRRHFARVRITSAVAWKWSPVWRQRVRFLHPVLVVAAVLVALEGTLAALALSVVCLGFGLGEMIRLKRMVTTTIRASVAEAAEAAR